MGKGLDLLRLLEPAVRPGNLPAPARTPQTPIESRGFESLLEEARAMNVEGLAAESSAPSTTQSSDAGGEAARPPHHAGLLGPLAQFDRVENSTLRSLMAGNRPPAEPSR